MPNKKPNASKKQTRGRKPKVVNTDNPKSLTELAAATGLNYRRILRLRQDGKLIQDKTGAFDVAQTLQAAQERGSVGPWSDRTPSKLATLKEQNLEASTRLKQLTVAKMAGRLVPAEDVQQVWDERINELRAVLKRLSRDLAPRLRMKETEEIKAEIDSYLPGLINILAKGKDAVNSTKA